jgi:hypothetical protein
MLVQKVTISKTTKILLIILGVAVLVGGGYLAFTKFFAKTDSTSQVNTNTGKAARTSIPTFDEKLFADPSFYRPLEPEYSGFTNQHEAVALSDNEPLPPKNVKVEDTTRGRALIISWELPDYVNFDKIRIYRSAQPGVLGEEIATLKENSATKKLPTLYRDTGLTDNSRYYYHVVTVNEDDKPSNVTEEPSGVPTDIFPPEAPKNVEVKAVGNKSVEISWQNPDNEDFTSVNVYRSSQRGVLGSIIYSDGTGEASESDPQRQIITDTNIAANTPYYYTVTSVDGNGNESSTDILGVPFRSGDYNPFEPITF